MVRGRLILSVALALAPVVGLTAVVVTPPAAYAAAKKIGPKLAPSMSEAQKLLKAKNYSGALKKLQEADAVPGKSAYEQYVINEWKGACYQALRRYGNAAQAYEATLSSGELSGSAVLQREVQVAQLYNVANNSSKAIHYANKVLARNPGNEDMLTLIGQSYYSKGDYANAAKYISSAISSAQRSGRRPSESSLQVLMSSQFKQGDNDGYTATLEKLVRLYPKKNYWNDLGRGMLNSKGITDAQSLDVWRLLVDVGALQKASDFTGVAELALLNGSPGEAKAVLDEGFKNGILGKGNDVERQKRLLANADAKAAASLKALAAQDAAAQATPSGQDDAAVGEAYFGHGQYANAITALERALQQGSLTDTNLTKLHLAQAYAKAKQTSKAKTLLKSITGTDLTARLAKLWAMRLS